jgi:hypothetical protein
LSYSSPPLIRPLPLKATPLIRLYFRCTEIVKIIPVLNCSSQETTFSFQKEWLHKRGTTVHGTKLYGKKINLKCSHILIVWITWVCCLSCCKQCLVALFLPLYFLLHNILMFFILLTEYIFIYHVYTSDIFVVIYFKNKTVLSY